MRRPIATLLLALLCAAGAACGGRSGAHRWDSDDQTVVVTNSFPQSPTPKLDVLFMIDNTDEPFQSSLQSYFPNFIQPLKDLPTRPDLHLGVITSDLGAGQFTPPSCDPIGGDQGLLQNTAKGSTCMTGRLNNPADRYLVYAPDSTGGAAVNFTGDLADAFACYAAIGTGGCGFEHQLASVRAALDGCDSYAGCKQKQNEGFFRRDAYLAVIILTDEDDCSAPPDSTLFDPTQTTLNSALGPLTSYRCFEFGNLCGGVDPGRTEGQRQDCVPGNKDADPNHQLIPTKEIADFIKSLKPHDPRMAYVSVIAGPPAPTAVGLDANGYPDLQPACTGQMGAADPAPRLAELLTWFDEDRARFSSICQPDLSQALTRIGHDLAGMLGRQCLSAPLKDRDPATVGLEPDCAVEDVTVTDAATGTSSHVNVPACAQLICDPSSAPGGECACQRHDGASPASPCWYIWGDQAACPMIDTSTLISEQTAVGSGYRIWIDRGTDAACSSPAPPPGTYAVVQCSACIANPRDGFYDCAPGCAPHWPSCCPTAAAGCFEPAG